MQHTTEGDRRNATGDYGHLGGCDGYADRLDRTPGSQLESSSLLATGWPYPGTLRQRLFWGLVQVSLGGVLSAVLQGRTALLPLDGAEEAKPQHGD